MAQNRLKQIETVATLTLLGLFPFFLFPGFSNPLVTGKLVLLSVFLVTIFVLKAVRNLTSKTKGLVFGSSNLDLPVLLLAAAYFISGYFVTPNRNEAFWLPGTASFVIGGALLYFVVHQFTEKGKDYARMALAAGVGAVSFFTILATSGILKSFTGLPAYMRADLFSPAGSLLAVVVLLIATTPLILDLIIHSEEMMTKAFAGVVFGVSALALLMGLSGIVRNWNQTQMPALSTSWVVATEALKERPFMGAGPGNYLSAFTRFLPLSYNSTPQWNLRFANANNFYLTAITETGLIGFAAIVILLFALYRRLRAQAAESHMLHYLPIVIMIVAFALVPASPVLIVMFFVLLGLSTRTHLIHLFTPAHEESPASMEGKVAIFLVAIPVIALSLFATFLTVQSARAEVMYQRAVTAIAAQDGKKAYDTLRDTINANPFVDRFHVTYAQLNLALANSIAQKKELTDDEKNTVSQLVQQAIREARVAVVLNRERATNWETLAGIYRAIIPLAKGADQFAVQTYSQTIALDPANANTRVALGGVFYGLKRYEEAIDVFRLATVAKADFANAHYNLAIAYRNNGQYDRAVAALSTVLSLVPKDSNDYTVAQKELENVQSKAPKKEAVAPQGDSLTPPTTIDDNAKLDPQVEIPSDATPPASLTEDTPPAQ